MSASEKTAAVSTTLPLLLLPQEILVEILFKLPAKSLVRFRCVSKFFSALIADHGFAVLYRSRSLALPSRAGVLISTPHAYYTINFSEEEEDDENCRGKLQAKRVGYFGIGRRLRSSSDGLICLSKPNGDVAVCNVSTGQCIPLPRIQSYFHSLTCALLGFDSESKRYKVLMSAVDYRDDSEFKHWVLTVGVDKSWREITNNCPRLFYPFDADGCPNYSHTSVYIHGVIYSYNWLTKYDPLSFDIVAFEVGSETFSVIPFPYEVPHAIIAQGIYHYSNGLFVRKNFALLEVDGGRLAIVLVHKSGGGLCYMDVWTYWPEKSKECCWEKITMTIPLDESRTINKVGFLRFTTNHAGEIVLLCINNNQQFSILVCNLKTKVWRKFDVGGVEEEFPIISPEDVRMYKTMDSVFFLEEGLGLEK